MQKENIINFINNSLNKIFKFDIKYFISGGFWLFLGQIITALSGFALAVFLGRYLSKEVYGEYRYIISMLGIFTVLCYSGYSVTVATMTAEGKTGILKKAFKNTLLSSLYGSVIAFIFSVYYFINDNNILAFGFLCITLFTPFLNSLQLYIPYLNGHRDFKCMSIFGMIPDLFSAISMILISTYFPKTYILVLTFFITNVFIHAIMYLISQNKYKSNNIIPEEKDKFSLHVSFMNIITVISFQLDKVLIFTRIGSMELAIFSFAQMIPQQIRGMQKIITPLSIPKFTEKDDFEKSIYLKMFIITFLVFLIAIIYILFSPLFFKIFFPYYQNSVYLSQIYILSIIFYPIPYVISSYLFAKRETKKLHIISISTAIFTILSNYLFIKYLGILGAAYSAIIIGAFICIIHVLSVFKYK